jgi:hypothetical protein
MPVHHHVGRRPADPRPGYSMAAGAGTGNAALFVPELARAAGFHWQQTAPMPGRGPARSRPGPGPGVRYGAGTASNRCIRCAAAAASPRLDTPTLARMFETWTLTVLAEMNSRAAISGFDWP